MRRTRFTALAAMSLTFSWPLTAQTADQKILVYSFGFTPKAIHLRAGQPVTLTFVNQSASGHDFTAASFFAASTIRGGAAPGGKISLAGHETKSITLIPRAGTYAAHCSHFLHSSMGMTDQIVVD